MLNRALVPGGRKDTTRRKFGSRGATKRWAFVGGRYISNRQTINIGAIKRDPKYLRIDRSV